MNPEERMAAQALIIDEMSRHQQDAPTMLIDALLADQGFAFLEAILKRKAAEANQAAQMTLQLYRGLAHHVPPALTPAREEVA